LKKSVIIQLHVCDHAQVNTLVVLH
jgi:hypothetical protein